MRLFFADHDLLVLPVSQVPPFPADQEFPTEINGRPLETYLDWMRSAYFITVTGCPALSLPMGHTPDGLPVGVQLVAPHGADLRLLEIALALGDRRGRGVAEVLRFPHRAQLVAVSPKKARLRDSRSQAFQVDSVQPRLARARV
ncbi:amidase family protein [Nocardioides sp.]|uniref:amidase family protein n=1 Tax=Nocardioides sp. TaxID=35761 RepID=UPI0035282372